MDASISLFDVATKADPGNWRGETSAQIKMLSLRRGGTREEAEDLARRSLMFLEPPEDWDEQLEDVATGDEARGEPIHIVCGRSGCGRSLGHYFAERSGDIVLLHPKSNLGKWRRGRVRYVIPEDGLIRYEWSCGCGRNDGYRRADRIGELPVTRDVTEPNAWRLVLS